MGDRPDNPYLAAYDHVASSSQIETWERCPRNWAYAYIEGKRDQGSKATELGTEVEDTQITPYLLEDREFDMTRPTQSGQIAAALRPYLDSIKAKPFDLQRHILVTHPTNPKLAIQGFLDVFSPALVPRIRDFKTSSDPLKWGKSADQLVTSNTQSVFYAYWALRGGYYYSYVPHEDKPPTVIRFNQEPAGGVELEWLYSRTKTPYKAHRVFATMWQSDIDGPMARVWKALEDISTAKATWKSAADAPATPKLTNPNPAREPEACGAFNGCPHRFSCSLLPNVPNKDRTIVPIDKNLLAKLKKNVDQKAPVAEAPATSGATLIPTQSAPPPAASSVVPVNPPEAAIDPATIPPLPDPAIDPDAPVAVVTTESSGVPLTPSSDPSPVVVAGAKTRVRRTKAQIEADEAAKQAAAGEVKATTFQIDVTGNASEKLSSMAESVRALTPQTTVTATWGREKFGGPNYSSCEVGPFSLTTEIRDGETTAQALNRAYSELEEVAVKVRAMKLEAWSANLGKVAQK